MRLVRRRVPTEPAVERRRTRLWSPAQPIALVVGAVSATFGAIALARSDVDLAHLSRHRSSFLGFPHTPLLAIAEIGFGVLMILAALRPIAGRSLMTLLGAAATSLGIVIVGGWWWAKLHTALGATDRNGWMFITVGGIVLVATLCTPVLAVGGPRVVQRPVDVPPFIDPVPVARAIAADDTRPGEPATRGRRLSIPFRRRVPAVEREHTEPEHAEPTPA